MIRFTLFISLLVSSLALAQEDERLKARVLDQLLDNHELFTGASFKSYVQTCRGSGTLSESSRNFCDYWRPRIQRPLDRLRESLNPLKRRQLQDAEMFHALSCLPEEQNQVNIGDLLHSLDQAIDCSPISVGGYRRFPVGRTYHNYLLRRPQENVYEATVVVNFNYESGDLNEDQMRARANSCFNLVAPFLRTPDGQQLRIRYLSPEEARTQLRPHEIPPAQQVALKEGTTPQGDYRGNTANFGDTFRCETITHETLHYLGLCDEYPEKDRTPVTGVDGVVRPSLAEQWSCRFVPEQNTVMHEHSRAFKDTLPLQFSCRCKDDSCRRTLAGTDQRSQELRSIMLQESPHSLFGSAFAENCRPMRFEETRGFELRDRDKRVVIHSENETEVIVESRYLFPGGTGGLLHPQRNFHRCSCNGDEECRRGLNRGLAVLRSPDQGPSLNSCPEQTEPVNPEGPFRFLPGSDLAPAGAVTGVRGDVINIVNTPRVRSQSLLAPNHMNRIIFGNCQTGPAAGYNQCAEFAIMSRENASCPERSHPCRTEQFFLGGVPQ